MPTDVTIDLEGKITPSADFARKTIEETISILETNIVDGLPLAEVEARRSKYGQNELEPAETDSLIEKFLSQLKQPLNLLLLGSAAVSLLLGQYDDAISIFAAILIVVCVAFVQEYRSEKSLEALNKLVPHYCHAIRQGHLISFLANELVPGDIVRLSTGDRIPADLRLVESNNLEVDESNLSGEAEPIKKTIGVISASGTDPIPVNDRKNIAYMGTLVRGGNALGIVIGTGVNTEFGKIWCMMRDVEVSKTPLQVKMEELGKQLSFVSFIIVGFIIFLGVFQRRGLLETFTIGVSLAVAAIPEGLPIVVTVTLALGVLRMSNKNAIVKRLPSVESLGAVNIICADKTGTLTLNQMTVTQIYTVSDGNLFIDKHTDTSNLGKKPCVQKLLQISCLCNNAHLDYKDENDIGQPTEIALLRLADILRFKDERSSLKRVSEIPFGSEQKWMSCEYEISGENFFFVKGAPDSVLLKCKKVYHELGSLPNTKILTSDHRESLMQISNQLSNLGLRVISLAYGLDLSDLVFVGFAAMYDPPRKGVVESINALQKSGIRIVMITGDSQGTAETIAKQMGILEGAGEQGVHVFSGDYIDSIPEDAIPPLIQKAQVFYRTTPRHKLMIVKAFQVNGNIVAMTGDGVNDAPSMKLADIGIAMGKSGTDVCKEAADMILVNDDFSTILSAVEEGKSIFYNIRNFLRFQLSTSVSALILIALSTILALPSPLNAMQILWINIIMDGPPAQSLGVEPVDHDVMKQPPRKKGAPIIDQELVIRILTSAVFVVGGTLWIYWSELKDGEVTSKDTTMTFTTFVLFDMFNALGCRSEKKSIFSIGFLTNKPFLYAVSASVICQLLVIYVPFFQGIFQTSSLSFLELLRIIILASSVWVFDEARKFLMREYERKSRIKFGQEYELV